MTSGWKIDKHIPIALILALLAQTAGFVWYFAKQDSRLEALEIFRAEILSKTNRSDDVVAKRLIALEVGLAGMQASLKNIEKSTDRIAERLNER